MSKTIIDHENLTRDIKLYSANAIAGATFLGGPLAAAYLIGENYKALDRRKAARNSVILGVVFMILLISFLLIIPEEIMDKIPGFLIPLVYTGIVLLIVEKTHGVILKKHKSFENEFFSKWRSVGIGIISMIIYLVVIFSIFYFQPNSEAYAKYEIEMAKFSKNEEESLKFYEHLQNRPDDVLLNELKKKVIPNWEENIKITYRINKIKDLPVDAFERNKMILKYSKLRLKAFQLMKTALQRNTEAYNVEIEIIHKEIDDCIENS